MSTAKAIVFGCFVNGLSLIRSLGRHGIPVVAVDYKKDSLGFYSKYVVEKAIAPDPRVSSNNFLSFLLNKSSKWTGSLLIPTNDEVLEILSCQKKILSKFYYIAAPNWSVLKKILSKKALHESALKVSVPIPNTIYLDSKESLLEHKDEYVYPCVLKPQLTYLFRDRFGKKVFIIRNFSDLKSKFEYTRKFGLDMMVQEIVKGKDDALYTYAAYYDSSGKPTAEYTSRKLRQNPPKFGGPRIMEVTNTPEIVEYSRELLSSISYTGLCNLEYKKDQKNGDFKLLDLNARSGISIRLPINNGVDFPWIMYNDIVLRKNIQAKIYDRYQVWIHIFNDLISFYRYRFNEEWKAREYIYPFFKRFCLAVFTWDDMLPFFIQWSKILPLFLNRLLFKRRKKEKIPIQNSEII